MKLTDEEQALRAGAFGRAAQWAIEHQIKVGRYLGARDFVAVREAHVMADTESLGAAGVEWLEHLARLPAAERRVRIPTITDPRHRLCGRAPAQAAALDARPRTPRDRRVGGARTVDDEHLHQLPNDYAAGSGRARRLRRYRGGDLLQQRVRRALELRGRAVGARRRAHRTHAALRLSPRGAAAGNARRQRRVDAARAQRLGRAGWYRRPLSRRLLAGSRRRRDRTRAQSR